MTDQNKTLAFLVTAFPPEVSGSSHFNWARAKWFAEQGYSVVVFAPDGQKGVESAHVSDNLRVERYESQPWIPYKLTYVPTIQAAREINQKIDLYQPDLIVMTDVERYFLLGAWQLPGRDYAQMHQVPYLAEYHTDVYNFSATYPGWQWLRSVVRWSRLLSQLYHRLDITVCPSAAASQSCREMGIQNTQIVPFFGTDVSSFSPKRCDRSWLAPWLSAEEHDHQTIVFLGRLGFEKRVDLLIDAFAQLKHRRSQISLLIIGDGPADVVRSLKQKAATIADIHFTGFLMGETKANVLASCDVFCSPSPYETFGMTVVEAMASGVPVITVESGAVAEYLIDCQNAYLVPPDDVAKLSDRIELALQADNTALVQQALQDALQYSVEHGCQQLQDYYQQLWRASDQAEISIPILGVG